MRLSPRVGTAGAALATLAALAVLAGGCRRDAGPEAPRLAPGAPIVLVSIDTLRSDRLPAYGYDGVETPALDAFRRDAILYRFAYSPLPLTFPAHATLLSGLLTPEHGVRDNLGYRLDSSTVPWLPRLLRDEGYATGGAVSSYVLRGETGMSGGFDFYDDAILRQGPSTDIGMLQRPGGKTLDAAVEWLRDVSGGPFFFLFHIYEPHSPYEAPEPFGSRYAAEPYDGEVAESDRIVGRLLDELRRLGAYERSLVVVTSDHGEGLGEHGYPEHGLFLYREALQVPLLVKLPGGQRAGDTVSAPVQLADLLPTVLELLGRPLPEELPGANLLTLDEAAPPRTLLAETTYPRSHFGWSELASAIAYPLHYIHGPDPELYDLEADPGETVNRVDERRDEARRLKAALDPWDRTLKPPEEVDAETRDRLAALGYVGSTAAALGDGPLPDPKSRVGSLERLTAAFQAHREGRFEATAAAAREALAAEPRMIDAWELLGHAHMEMGRPEEAWKAYRRALELGEGAAHLAQPAANALLALGRLDEARAHAELASTAVDAAWDLLAQIDLKQGRLEDAARHVARALETRRGRVGPLLTAAELKLRQGRLEEAIELADRAEREAGGAHDATLRGLDWVRGAAWARLGEADRAVAAFEREIERSPDLLAAYTELAFLHGLLGNGPASGAALRRMVEAVPTPRAYGQAVATLRRLGDESSARRVLGLALSRWPGDPGLRELAAAPGP